MIFYFSGTGNSLFAAHSIAKMQGEKLISIAKEFEKTEPQLIYDCAKDELVGFVFPVYAWLPPKIVLDFIKRIQLTGSKPYLFSVCTCGEEEGQSTEIMQKTLAKKQLSLDSAFTIKMPNNYPVGFDVDTKEVRLQKLQAAEIKIIEINTVLKERKFGIFDLHTGKFKKIKSMINPLFNRFALNTKRFYALNECTGCGLCEKICPVHSITVDKKPVWNKSCTQCFACINRCPVQAIQYGKGTEKKGRYHHPILDNISEL